MRSQGPRSYEKAKEIQTSMAEDDEGLIDACLRGLHGIRGQNLR